VRRLADVAYNPAKLGERRARLAGVFAAADAAARDANRVGSPTTRPVLGMGLNPPDLWAFADRRAESIRRQLAGTEVGHKPEFDNVKVTLDDWAPHTVAAVAFLRAADADGDRRVSDDEVGAAIGRLFEAAGAARDGAIGRDAMTVAIDKLLTDDVRRRVPARAWADWVFKVADADKSGTVTAEEVIRGYQRFKARADADRDGRIDLRELVEMMGSAAAPRDPDPRR
jgi:hypothetical protein